MVLRSTIYKQKRKVSAFFSISPYLLLFSPISSKTILKYSKNSSKKYNRDMRRSSGS